MEATRDSQKSRKAQTITALGELKNRDFAFRKVKVTGTFDNARSVLFRHRQYQKKPGYWVGTPLVLQGGKEALLVNRGWVPKQLGRDYLKKLSTTPATSSTYEGMLHIPQRIIADRRTRLQIKNKQTTLKDGRLELATYDLELMQQHVPQRTPKIPMILVLDAKHSGDPMPIASLSYITKPYMTSDRHMSYFVFWYTMAAVLLGLYLGYTFGFVSSPRPKPQSA